MKKALILLLVVMCTCALASCKPVQSGIIEVTADPNEVITVTPAPAAPTPMSVLASITDIGSGDEYADEYAEEELNGIADPADVLPMHDSYDEAKALNSEVIGWITIPGTIIDYPVTRCDNNKYYLGRDVEKNKSKYGSIFMDFRNADSAQQKHIIIYGHNMKNGSMFHELMNFKQKDFFDDNRTIYFLWDGTETQWEIYLSYIVMPKTIYHIHTLFASDQNFADVMNDTIKYAKTVSPMNVNESVTIKPTDQVMTLSTCTYEYDGSYFAVMARRIK